MKVYVEDEALDKIEKFSINVKTHLRNVFNRLAHGEKLGVHKIPGTKLYAKKAGEYRIIFLQKEDSIIVLDILTYKQFQDL